MKQNIQGVKFCILYMSFEKHEYQFCRQKLLQKFKSLPNLALVKAMLEKANLRFKIPVETC